PLLADDFPQQIQIELGTQPRALRHQGLDDFRQIVRRGTRLRVAHQDELAIDRALGPLTVGHRKLLALLADDEAGRQLAVVQVFDDRTQACRWSGHASILTAMGAKDYTNENSALAMRIRRR